MGTVIKNWRVKAAASASSLERELNELLKLGYEIYNIDFYTTAGSPRWVVTSYKTEQKP